MHWTNNQRISDVENEYKSANAATAAAAAAAASHIRGQPSPVI